MILDNGRALAAPVRRFRASNWAPFAKRHSHGALMLREGRAPRLTCSRRAGATAPSSQQSRCKGDALFRRKGLNRLWRQTGDNTQVLGREFQLAEGVLFGTAPTPSVPTLRRQLKTELLRTLHVT